MRVTILSSITYHMSIFIQAWQGAISELDSSTCFAILIKPTDHKIPVINSCILGSAQLPTVQVTQAKFSCRSTDNADTRLGNQPNLAKARRHRDRTYVMLGRQV